jgi:Phospholipase_D-nuclease N-terminal
MGIFAIIYIFTSFLPEMIRLDRLGEEPDPIHVLSTMAPFFILIILSALLHIGLLIFFIIHAINNKQVKSEERIIWVLVFIFVSSIGFPIYWAIRIWPEPKPESNFVKM